MRKSPISLFFSLLRSAIMESLSWLYSFRTSVDRLPKKDTWRRRCDRFELESIYSPFCLFLLWHVQDIVYIIVIESNSSSFFLFAPLKLKQDYTENRSS